jgi:hypothetical protein
MEKSLASAKYETQDDDCSRQIRLHLLPSAACLFLDWTLDCFSVAARASHHSSCLLRYHYIL